jgi:hypothetical protein
LAPAIIRPAAEINWLDSGSRTRRRDRLDTRLDAGNVLSHGSLARSAGRARRDMLRDAGGVSCDSVEDP